MAQTVLNLFITKFRYEFEKGVLDEVKKSLGELKNQAFEIGALFVEVFSGKKFFEAVNETVDELNDISEQLGLTTKQVQSLKFAIEESGGSFSNAVSSLENLSRILGETARGAGNFGLTFMRAGISVTDMNGKLISSYQLFLRLNQAFQAMSASQRLDIGQQLGLDRETIHLLQQSPAVFHQYLKESKRLGEFSKEDAEKIFKLRQQVIKLDHSFFNLKVNLSSTLAPAFEKVLLHVTNFFMFLNEHQGILKTVEVAIISTAAAFGLLGLRAVAAWAAVGLPIVGTIAALSALVLAVQDVWTSLKGGKGIILPFIKNSKILMGIWHVIEATFNRIVKAFTDIASLGTPLFNALSSFFRKQTNLLAFDNLPRLGSTSNQYMTNTAKTSNVNVNVGGVTVNTQASDAGQIANVIDSHLRNSFKNSVNYFDSDIAR